MSTGGAAATTLVPVDSMVLGMIEVPAAAVMEFRHGLHGFEDERRFALVPTAREGLFVLQSMTQREIAFFLVDPFAVDAGYALDLGPAEREALGVDGARPEDVLVLCVVTLPMSEQAQPTTNLRGPVVCNLVAQRGMQVVSRDETYPLHAPVDLQALPARVA